MCSATCQLAFKTRVRIFRTILPHGGPETFMFEEFVHFLPPYVVVLHVDFLHDQQLVALRCKMDPPVVLPRQQLASCKRITFGKLFEICM
jgi:hypothetical protein